MICLFLFKLTGLAVDFCSRAVVEDNVDFSSAVDCERAAVVEFDVDAGRGDVRAVEVNLVKRYAELDNVAVIRAHDSIVAVVCFEVELVVTGAAVHHVVDDAGAAPHACIACAAVDCVGNIVTCNQDFRVGAACVDDRESAVAVVYAVAVIRSIEPNLGRSDVADFDSCAVGIVGCAVEVNIGVVDGDFRCSNLSNSFGLRAAVDEEFFACRVYDCDCLGCATLNALDCNADGAVCIGFDGGVPVRRNLPWKSGDVIL